MYPIDNLNIKKYFIIKKGIQPYNTTSFSSLAFVTVSHFYPSFDIC